MSKKNTNPNRQGFMSHVDTIKHIEADKDTFLKASRLERHESRREPLKASDLIKIAVIIGASIILCTVLVLGYMSGHFVPALIGVGFIAFIGIMMGAMMCD